MKATGTELHITGTQSMSAESEFSCPPKRGVCFIVADITCPGHAGLTLTSDIPETQVILNTSLL